MPQQFQFGGSSGGEPMPVVRVTLANKAGRVTPSLTAIVDTGADGTLVPLPVLDAAGFRPGRARRHFVPGGVGHSVETVSGYKVTIRFGELSLRGVDIYGSSLITDMILGRNVLNQLVFTYDGPHRRLEIHGP
jgi:hypothetical protein